MKKLLALLLCMLMVLGTSLAAVGEGEKTVLNLWSFTDEVPKMVDKFMELNPDFAAEYEFNVTQISTTDGAYQPALDLALAEGSVDLFCAESAFVLKYTQGDAYQFAAPYKDLGIDVDAELAAAEIAPYTVDIGTNPNCDLVGLGYQATGGAFVYRRSIAIDTWGTDDPAVIATKVGPGWDQFFVAAEELKAKGYGIVSGDGDIWNAIRTSTDPWIVDGKLNLSEDRMRFMEFARTLYENDYSNKTQDWQDAWFADFKGEGEKPIFGSFGPAWLINYVMVGNVGGSAPGEGTFGDWAICVPPVGFFWGGTWLIGAEASQHKDAVGKFIEWITLDPSDTGLQYYWANGTLFGEGGTKDTVGSGVVMAKSNGEVALLGGQNMFTVFVPATAFATGDTMTQYDETINLNFRDKVRGYAAGELTLDEAIEAFKQQVADNLDVIVE